MSISLADERDALQRENAALKNQVESLRRGMSYQVSINRAREGSRSILTLMPDVMVKRFQDVHWQIDTLVDEMEGFLHMRSYRKRIISAMQNAEEAKTFRAALTRNTALRALAVQPLATERQMWTACIWQFLVGKVFSDDGVRAFYSSQGQNAGYYIKNLDEIEYLMRYDDETPSDDLARRSWRKQAIDAVFPTEDHPWLASTREQKIEELASELLRILGVFAEFLPDGLALIRDVVTHAVRLNEYMMHDAQTTYTIDLDLAGETDDEFFDNLNNMRMAVVNTDSGEPVNMETAMKGQLQTDIRSRLYNVCTIEPAFTSQTFSGWDSLDIQYAPVRTEVKSTVAVGWALNRDNPPRSPSMFYIMAQSLGYAPSG